MSELPLLLIVFWAAVNPPASAASLASAALPGEQRTRLLASAAAVAAALLLLAAVLHGPLLDLLDVSAASFDVAAGIVMIAGAARPLLRGRAIEEAVAAAAGDGQRAILAPLAVPLLATPAALVAAVSWGERAGEWQTALVAIVLVALTALWLARGPQPRSRAGRAALDALARLTGALLAVLAVGLVVQGIMAV